MNCFKFRLTNLRRTERKQDLEKYSGGAGYRSRYSHSLDLNLI